MAAESAHQAKPVKAKKTVSKCTLALRLALCLGTLVSLWFVPWIIVKAWLAPLPHSVDEQLQQSLGYGFDGILVYVDTAGQAPAWYSAGWHDRAKRIPADPQAYFKIASISKLYLALAVTQLATTKQLSLDAPVSQYFPELAGKLAYAERITIKMLVQHQSGIANFSDSPGYWQQPNADNADKLAKALALSPAFAPGESTGYSNTNYLLLGMLVERVTGMTHAHYIQHAILQPLKLTHTFASMDEVEPARLMSGYYVGYDADLKTNHYGSMVATAADVGRFIRALHDGSAFSSPQQQALYLSLYPAEHGGLIPGYQSLANYYPEIDTVVVQLINTTNFDGYEWNLSQVSIQRIADILERQRDTVSGLAQ